MGGAIAVGHPLASSGVRLMTQLARHFADHPEVRYGITTMCVGLGRAARSSGRTPTTTGRPERMTRAPPIPTEHAARRVIRSPTRSSPTPSVRDVDLPGGAGTAALITLDNGFDHTKPNTFGPAGLRRTRRRPRPGRAPTTGTRGDLRHRQAVHLRRRRRPQRRPPAHRPRAGPGDRPARARGVRAGSASSTVPTFAFINGAAMGGGLEVALHCTYRTMSSRRGGDLPARGASSG